MSPSDTPHVALPVLRCGSCGALAAGPRQLCGACRRPALTRIDVPGAGRLVSWTVIRRAPLQFRREEPYAVCVVDLDCGVRTTGRLAGFEAEPAPGSRVSCVARTGDVGVFSREA